MRSTTQDRHAVGWSRTPCSPFQYHQFGSVPSIRSSDGCSVLMQLGAWAATQEEERNEALRRYLCHMSNTNLFVCLWLMILVHMVPDAPEACSERLVITSELVLHRSLQHRLRRQLLLQYSCLTSGISSTRQIVGEAQARHTIYYNRTGRT